MPLAAYDDFVIGKQTRAVEITVDARRVRDFVYAVDDFNPWHLYDSPFGGPIAPGPLLTSDDPEFAPEHPNGPEDTLAAKYGLTLCEPIKIGQRVALQGRNVEKYVRRGKAYIVRSFEARAVEDGRPLIQSTLTETLGAYPEGDPSRPGPAESDRKIQPKLGGLPVQHRADPTLAVATPLPTLTKAVTRKQMFVFSARAGWWTSIHTDPDFARSFGFPDAIAQGLMSTGYFSEMCASFFQERWFSTGEISLKFIRPVCVGDTLSIQGCVAEHIEQTPDTTRLKLDLWAINQHGELTTVGEASALVS